MQGNVDNPAIGRLIAVLVLVFGAVFVAFMAIKTGTTLLYALVFVLPAFLILMKAPQKLLILAFWVGAVGIDIPGLARFSVQHVILIGVVGLVWGGLAMKGMERKTDTRAGNTILALFALNMLLIMITRGFGLRILGGSSYGGGLYIQWAVMLVAFFCVRYLNLNDKEAKWLVVGLIVLPLINPVIQQVVARTGGEFFGLARYFSNVHLRSAMQVVQSGTMETYRARTGALGALFQMAGFLLFARKQRFVPFAICILVGMIFVMLTGFRSGFVSYAMIAGIGTLVFFKRRVPILVIGLIVGGLVYGGLILTYDVLPYAVQRAASFLPGIKATGQAAFDAQQTLDWRFEIWRYAWDRFPEFAAIGRGLTWDITAWKYLGSANYGSPFFYFANHNYHSGPVTLLVDYGIPGTVLWIGFQVWVLRYVWSLGHLCMQKLRSDFVCAFYLLTCIKLSWGVFSFYAMYGQTSTMIPFVSTVMMMVLLRTYLDNKYRTVPAGIEQ